MIPSAYVTHVLQHLSGTGPNGDTHRAKLRGTDVAVKVIKANEALSATSLMTDLNALFKMRHPNVVSDYRVI